jgi:hypothetical protein
MITPQRMTLEFEMLYRLQVRGPLGNVGLARANDSGGRESGPGAGSQRPPGTVN